MDRLPIGFVYTIEHYAKDGTLKSTETAHNIIPSVGIDYMLNAAMTGGAQYSTWYLGIYEAAYTPLSTDTMTTLIAACTESTAHDSATRPEVEFPAVASGLISTADDPTILTFDEDATITGAFLTSNPTISNTSGLLLSAVRFSSPKTLSDGEYLRVPVGIALASV